jgi:cardiolipin synthase
VYLRVDGFGSSELPEDFIRELRLAGAHFHVFSPVRRFAGFRTGIFRRLHRKLAVVDSEVAFVGGINFCADHLRNFGPESKQDYAAVVSGPVVAEVEEVLRRGRPSRWWRRRTAGTPPAQDGGRAALVVRDNAWHRQDIERMYRVGIRTARREILIANAYFFPGYRLLRDLHNAARRGVAVSLILQGRPDMPFVRWAAQTLHRYLLHGGVRIFEYVERPLHAKVAVVDGRWATVGSSNLDPLSLFLNLEANLLIDEPQFAGQLRDSLQRLLREHCVEITQPSGWLPAWAGHALGALTYHVLRRWPFWAAPPKTRPMPYGGGAENPREDSRGSSRPVAGP